MKGQENSWSIIINFVDLWGKKGNFTIKNRKYAYTFKESFNN
jgi:hypothetical protein